jgi:hypothetical protein
MARKGGNEWYQSIGLLKLNISADFEKLFKGPPPFKKQKTFWSGYRTPQGASLNQGACRVNN